MIKENIIKKEPGITITSLVITIIILIILAGVSITTLTSENGIIEKANEAKFKSELQQIKEELQINILNRNMSKYDYDERTLSGNINEVLGKEEVYNFSDILFVNSGKLVYTGTKEKEKIWAEDLGIKVMDVTTKENKLALNIEEVKDIAVEKDKITKNQYPYRITGELKERIEEKLGRNIDYSIDRFYEVNYKNIMPEMEDGKTYIYSPNSGIVIEVKEQTQRNIGTWFWKGSTQLDIAIMENKSTQDLFFEKLENYNISQIYISQKFDNLIGNTQIENFVANAYSRDIKVYIATGQKTDLNENIRDKSIYIPFDTLEKYNESVEYNKRIAGIVYDAEFWLNTEYEWKTNEEIRNKHIKYIKDANEYANSKELEVIFALPFWLVQFNYTDESGNSINMYDEVSKISEEVALMLYRDSSEKINSLVSNVQNNAGKSLYEYSIQNECTLNISVETIESSEGDYVTFYEEESKTLGYVMQELNKLQSLYSPNWEDFTFSIHHASNLINFLGGIETQNVIEIGTAQELVTFLSHTSDATGKVYKLTADIDMTGYTVSAYNNIDNGFSGTFDGNNHTIENLSIESTELTGLFKKIGTNGIVKNLNIKNSTIETSAYYAGAISGTNWGTIINCSNQNTSVTAQRYAGGLVGRNYGTIKNSFNTGNITCEQYYVGGITGKNETNATIYNVYSTGIITEKGADGAKGAITAQNVGTIEKAYWLEGSSPKAIGYQSEGETISMKMTEMMTTNFALTLNSNRVDNLNLREWKLDKEGEEYPHF